ncbi:hypothetical protein E2P81_ATG01605 [Venturia nashicola]|nr:hypothetical protein E2P81_ATG01605 [Venturia nashicola]
MCSTNDNDNDYGNDLSAPTLTRAATEKDKKLELLALPQELRQRILLFSVADDELDGYMEISLKYHRRPLQIAIPYEPRKLKQWKTRLDLVHSQIQKDMVWVFKRRGYLASKIPFPNDGRESRWAPGW